MNNIVVIIIGFTIFVACRKQEATDQSALTCSDLKKGIEDRLATLYDFKYSDGNSLQKVNQEIVSLLKKIEKNKDLENCDLNYAGVIHISSDDGRLKFLSWDTEGRGTMKEFATVAIFQENDSLTVELLLGEDGNTYETFYEIYTLQNSHGETLYLVKAYFVGSTIVRQVSVKCFQIRNGLAPVAIFPDNQNQLTVGYELSSPADSLIDITVSEQGRKLLVPTSDGESLTGGHEEFDFNGVSFVSAQQKP